MIWIVLFFNDTATTEIYTLSLHDALPISATSRLQVTGTDRSAAGSRRVRKTVAAPRRDSWATWPSTQTSPSRPIHSATLRATVRTGQGASGVEGEVTPPACQTVDRKSVV